MTRHHVLLIAGIVFNFVFWLLFHPQTPLFTADSAGYLEFNAQRSAGYPLFLMIFQSLGVSAQGITIIQSGLYSIAMGFLLWAMYHVEIPKTLIAFAFLLIGFNPVIVYFHFMILTDSLFTSLQIVICGIVLLFLFDGRMRWLVLLSTIAGISITIRPVGYFLIPFVGILLVMKTIETRQLSLSLISAATLPLVLFILLENNVYRSIHGLERQSELGVSIFAKGVMVSDKGVSFAGPYEEEEHLKQLNNSVNQAYAPVRKLIDEAPNAEVRHYISRQYELFAQYQLLEKERTALARQAGVPLDTFLRTWAMVRIRENVMGYLQLTWGHLRAQWTMLEARYPPNTLKFNTYVQNNRPLPFEEMMEELMGKVSPIRMAGLVRVTLRGLGILTAALALILMGYIVFLRIPSLVLSFAGLFSLGIHGYFLLCSMAGIWTNRYTVAMWPMIVMTGIGLMLACWRRQYST